MTRACEVENDAMVFLAQKRFAGCLGRKDSGLALDAEVAVSRTPMLSARAQCCATRRTTNSERWMLRLSQTISHRVLGAALLSKLSRKRAKSCSVRVLPTTP